MKTLKNQILFIMMILSSSFSYAQEPSTLTLVSFKNIHDTSNLVVDLEGKISSTTWDKDYMLIEMEIKADNVSLEVAKLLIKEERFCLKMRPLGDGSFYVYMPNFKLPVYINGEELSEDITCQVYLPEGVNMRVMASVQISPCPIEIQPLASMHKESKISASQPAKGKEGKNTSL